MTGATESMQNNHEELIERMPKNVIRVLNTTEAEIVRLNNRVLEESPDLVAIIGSDCVYYYVNPAYAGVHGMKREDFIGFHVKKFLGEEVFEQILRPNIERCVAGDDVHYEDWFDFGGGGARFMDVRYLPLHDDGGAVDRIIVVSRDITYRKEAEEFRLTEEKLRTIVALAGTYNHEINNPLCALNGYLELLCVGESDPRKLEYLEKAREELRRVSEVTRKMEQMTAVTFADYPCGSRILDVEGECRGEA